MREEGGNHLYQPQKEKLDPFPDLDEIQGTPQSHPNLDWHSLNEYVFALCIYSSYLYYIEYAILIGNKFYSSSTGGEMRESEELSEAPSEYRESESESDDRWNVFQKRKKMNTPFSVAEKV